MSSMRGLTNFISDIRKCANKTDEKNRVLKELSNIRNKFQKGVRLDPYSRKKHKILGYDIDVGHVEAMQLISAKSYGEKKTGYTVCSIMFNEKHELLTMIIQSIKHDLHKDSREAVQCLALAMVANVGGRTMSDALWKDVCTLLTSGASRGVVRKKACLCMLRLFRKAPENIEVEAVAPKVIAMIGDEQFGVATCAVQLCIGLVSYYSKKPPIPSIFRESVPKAITLLHKLATGHTTSHDDYKYYGILCPWLQVKCLRLLQFFPAPKNPNDRKRLEGTLKKILFKEKKRSSKTNKNNAEHAILFESISLVIHYAQAGDSLNKALLDKCAALLGRFVALKEANIRYLGLDTMARLAKVEGTLDKIKEQLTTIQYSLHKDLDVSIRKRALDMLFVMCDKSNAPKIIQELLVFLRESDYGIREELVLKIAILAERFATDLRWYIDVILKLITIAGNYVSDDIWYRVIQIVTNNENLQKYAGLTMYKALQSDSIHENGIKVGGYIIGEFCDQMYSKKISGEDIFKVIHKHFPTSSLSTKALLLSAYVKLSNTFPELREIVQPVFEKYKEHADIEIQQRACEYAAINGNPDSKVIESVFEVMPIFEGEAQNALIKKAEKKSRRRSVGGETKEDNDDDDEDEDEDDDDDDEDEGEEDEDEDDEESRDDSYTYEFNDQTSEEFQDLLQATGSSGYLYKNSALQIGVKMIAGVSSSMKLKIFYGNKSDFPIVGMFCSIPNSSDWSIQVKPTEAVTIDARKQEFQFLLAKCHRPFSKIPEMKISFSHNDDKQSIRVRLPVIATQFVTSYECDGKKFIDHWKKWDKEAKSVINLDDEIGSLEDFKSLLAQQMHCSEVNMEGHVSNPDALLCATGVFEALRAADASVIKMPVLARFQFKKKAFQITVRSQVSSLSEAIINSVKAIHGAL